MSFLSEIDIGFKTAQEVTTTQSLLLRQSLGLKKAKTHLRRGSFWKRERESEREGKETQKKGNKKYGFPLGKVARPRDIKIRFSRNGGKLGGDIKLRFRARKGVK